MCQHMYRNPRARHIHDRVEWSSPNGNGISAQLTFDETNCYFILLVFFFRFLFVCCCSRLTDLLPTVPMVHAPHGARRARTHNIYFQVIKTKTHAHRTLDGSWSTLCDLSCAFFRHTCACVWCVSLEKSRRVTVNRRFAREKFVCDWKRQFVSCVSLSRARFVQKLFLRNI